MGTTQHLLGIPIILFAYAVCLYFCKQAMGTTQHLLGIPIILFAYAVCLYFCKQAMGTTQHLVGISIILFACIPAFVLFACIPMCVHLRRAVSRVGHNRTYSPCVYDRI